MPCLVQVLRPLLEDPGTLKLFHDVHMDAAALHRQHGIVLDGVLDTQLVYEHFHRDVWGSLGRVLAWCAPCPRVALCPCLPSLSGRDTPLTPSRPHWVNGAPPDRGGGGREKGSIGRYH